MRLLIVVTLSLGINYIIWRWTSSVNWSAWPIAVPLVLAETYSLLDAVLFGLTMWRLKERPPAPSPPDGATVDVFITTYNEPVELVTTTARAARDIRWPHQTWILDDGARAEMREAAESLGIGYIQRGPEWDGLPRHAKAGNLNNALALTEGEFMLILDADQIPSPEILHRTLGWFRDERVALVQTPQWFTNVTDADPLGSQAPLFYGPIQQGKDGWNAAFFCGSNAILRREALMQAGLADYVRTVRRAVTEALDESRRVLRRARRHTREQGPAATAAIRRIDAAAQQAQREVRQRIPLALVTQRFQSAVDEASRELVAADVSGLEADLAALEELRGTGSSAGTYGGEGEGEVGDGGAPADSGVRTLDLSVMERLSDRDWTPLGALESVKELIRAVDVDRAGEAQAVMPMSTVSVTEDMATAMRLHGTGWKSVYHHEVLAHGLAPEDLGTMLHQRLRWAQGTLQVLLRENPLRAPGLQPGQRLMYFATMWSYLSGFAAVVYIAAPILYLLTGVKPVETFGGTFLWHLVPFLIANQLLFLVVAHGVKTWRGQQYSLALFPLWIRAVTTAVGNVFFGKSLGFVVTPKTRQAGGPQWRLIRPQLVAMGLLAVSAVVGLVRLGLGQAKPIGILVNAAWVVFDIVILSVVVTAARYRGFPETSDESAPA
ncbi:MAG: glycosyltransferase family 2 protein [Actinomycetales bacterium]